MRSAEVLADQRKLVSLFLDEAHYRQQLTDPVTGSLLDHYLETGAKAGLNPCRYFQQGWYEWQNPDYAADYDNGFVHYLAVGRFEGRDPSPLADMRKYAATLGAGLSPEEQGARVLRNQAGPGCGVYSDFGELERKQEQFFNEIHPVVLRGHTGGTPRRNLVFLQAGPSGLQQQWLPDATNRNWDLFVNLYDARAPLPEQAEYIVAQPGTKASAMWFFVTQFAEIARKYEHILFLDDDITVDGPLVNRLFETCAEHDLDAAQMALSADSNCVWPLFFDQGTNGPRYTNGVEIMMPVLSRRLLFACRDLLKKSVSGFGLDLAIGQRAGEMGTNNVAVLDNVVAEHLKPIDTDGGGLYRYLRDAGINPKAELWNFVERYGTEKKFHSVSGG